MLSRYVFFIEHGGLGSRCLCLPVEPVLNFEQIPWPKAGPTRYSEVLYYEGPIFRVFWKILGI